MRRWSKRSITILAIVAAVLLAVRLAIPYIAKAYVNRVLERDIPGYTGHLDDIHLAFWRGTSFARGLRIRKVTPQMPPRPFLELPDVEFSLAWKALLHGRVVGWAKVKGGSINFVKGRTKKEDQFGMDTDWQTAMDKLMPIKLEELHVENFEAHYVDVHAKPAIDIFVEQIAVTGKNLGNVVKKNALLPASVSTQAKFRHGGNVKVAVAANILAKPPNFDFDASLTGIDLKQFNPFFKAYANFDVTRGQLDIFAEAASRDGKIKGYVKPVLTHVDVIKDDYNIDWAKEIFPEISVGAVNFFIRNYSQDRTAVKIPFEGNLLKPDVDKWAVVKSIFSNAFGTPLAKKLDRDINIGDVPKAR